MSIARTISRYACFLLLGALSIQANAQVATSAFVRADSFVGLCAVTTSSPGATTTNCSFVDPSGNGFAGFAGAWADVGGTLGAQTQFDATNMLQLAGQENISRANASWTDHYIVPANVTHIDFLFHVSGEFSFIPGADLSGFNLLSISAGLGMRDRDFRWSFGGVAVSDAGDGSDFVIGIDRFVDFFGTPIPDAFASDITTELELFAGPETTTTDVLISGGAFVDFSNTAQLIGLDLFGADGRITDIATVTSSSGHVYSVAGFVSNVPEPSSYALLLLGLTLLPLARRGLPRQDSRARRLESGSVRGADPTHLALT